MGADVGLPENDHPLLAQCISELLSGTQRLLRHPDRIECLAQHYVSHIPQALSHRIDFFKLTSKNANPSSEALLGKIRKLEHIRHYILISQDYFTGSKDLRG